MSACDRRCSVMKCCGDIGFNLYLSKELLVIYNYLNYSATNFETTILSKKNITTEGQIDKLNGKGRKLKKKIGGKISILIKRERRQSGVGVCHGQYGIIYSLSHAHSSHKFEITTTLVEKKLCKFYSLSCAIQWKLITEYLEISVHFCR